MVHRSSSPFFGRMIFQRENMMESLLLLLFGSLALHRNFSTVFIVLLFLISIADRIRKKNTSFSRLDWFLPTLFFYYLISNLLTGGTWSAVETRLLLLAIPILFCLNPGFFRESLKPKIYWAYVVGILLAEVICFSVAFNNSFSVVDNQLVFNPKVFPDEQYDFLTASVRDGNYFFGDFFSIFHHPIYFGAYVVVAQIFIFEIFSTSRTLVRKALLVLLYSTQFLILFLLSTRAAIIGSLALTLLLFWTTQRRLYLRMLILLGVVILSSLYVTYNPKMKILAESLWDATRINPNARSGHDLRTLTWDASLDIIRSHWLIGVGEGSKDAALLAKFDEKGYVIPLKEKFNSHNQYLDLLVGGGLIALGIYLSGICRLILRAWRERLFFRPLLIFVLFFSFEALLENLLSRHAGVLLFSVFITYLSNGRRDDNIS